MKKYFYPQLIVLMLMLASFAAGTQNISTSFSVLKCGSGGQAFASMLTPLNTAASCLPSIQAKCTIEALVSGVNATTNELMSESLSIKPVSKNITAEQFVSGLNNNLVELYNGLTPMSSDEYNIIYDEFDCLYKADVYISTSGAETASFATNYCVSDYLPVYGDKMVIKSEFQGNSAGYAFYDANKVFISKSGGLCPSAEKEVAIPQNAAYVRLSNRLPCRDWPMYCKMKTTDESALAARQAVLDDPNRESTLYVLSFGNSFLLNTMDNIRDICKNIGVDKCRVLIEEVAYSGWSLENYVNGNGNYEGLFSDYANRVYGTQNMPIVKVFGDSFGGSEHNANAPMCELLSRHWDVITFQQVSSSSGDYATYQPYLNILAAEARGLCQNKDVNVKFMMTWARHDGNNEVLYSSIVAANQELLADDENSGWEFIGNIVPAGTAIENIRGTSLNDSFFSYDQQHLSQGVGQYTAGCCWYQSVIAPFSGKSIFEDETTTVAASSQIGSVAVTSENRLLCQKAAMYACINPWQVTDIEIQDENPCGDVNQNDTVNITDVTCLIDYLLSDDAIGISLVNADCNLDGIINITDVTTLIDYLLSGTWPWDEPQVENETFTVDGVTFNMVTVEGGTFTMGSTVEQDSDLYSDEEPAHQVILSSYAIGETEVTQALWQAVMGENPSCFTENLQRPVEQVSWNDCQTFISKLNQLTGRTFRLPSEAEWEFAARGGNKSRACKYAGSNTLGDVAWYIDNSYSMGSSDSDYGTHPVGSKAPNELGLYDMSGNVWEWCQDRYDSYSGDVQTNPTGSVSGSNRVRRGGSWVCLARYCRVSRRQQDAPTIADDHLGFRLAL